MDKILQYINTSFGVYNIKGIYVEPTYWQAGAIVFLIFLLILTFARLRWLYIHWSFGKSSFSMIFWGFMLALVLEGFLILSGRTILTEIIGWDNAPKPLSTALDMGREKLVDVLGEQSEIPVSSADEKPNYQSVLGNYENLGNEDKDLVKSFICKP